MIVDAHSHLGELARFRAPDTTVHGMLSLMDHLAIDVAINIHAAGIMGYYEEAYEQSVKAYEQSEHRLPFCLAYSPVYSQDSLTVITTAANHPGFVGVKIHPVVELVMPDDPAYDPAWQFAAQRRLPIVTHSWAAVDYNPSQRFAVASDFDAYVARYPEVNLILGHAGGRYTGHVAAADLARKYPNVYLDLSGDVYSFGLIEWLVANVGADRVLFGTDMNWIDPRTILGRVLDAGISLEAKKMILGDNACRLFRLCP